MEPIDYATPQSPRRRGSRWPFVAAVFIFLSIAAVLALWLAADSVAPNPPKVRIVPATTLPLSTTLPSVRLTPIPANPPSQRAIPTH